MKVESWQGIKGKLVHDDQKAIVVDDDQAQLAQAQADLKTAQATQASDEAILAQAKTAAEPFISALTAAKATTVSAEAKLNTAQAALQAAQTAETKAKQAAQVQHQIQSTTTAKTNGYTINHGTVVDANGTKVAGWTVNAAGQMVDDAGNVITTLKAANLNATSTLGAKTTQTQKTSAKAMPTTSDAHESSLSIIGFALMSLFGLAGLAERKRRVG